MLTSNKIAALAVKALDDKKARDIQILKTDKVTVLADYFILCTASSTTHIMNDIVVARAKTPAFASPVSLSTMILSDWFMICSDSWLGTSGRL